MIQKSIIYLSGKMRGLPDYGRGNFKIAENMLKQLGFQVINPALLPTGLKEHSYMPICTAMIDACDILVLIDGWENSKGSIAEAAYAECQGKKITTLPNFINLIDEFKYIERKW